MVDARKCHRLVAHAMPCNHAANTSRREQFDGNIPAQTFVMRTKNHSHATGADLLEQTIATQHFSDMLNGGGHREACGNRRMEAAEKQSKATPWAGAFGGVQSSDVELSDRCFC